MAKHKFKKVVKAPSVVEIKQKVNIFQRSELWLSKRQRTVIAIITTVSILFRIIYFIQLNQGPCIWQHRFEESDMHFYDQWAKLIAKGDWLSNRSFHQYNAPQQWIADYYFKSYPDKAQQYQQQLGNDKSPEAMGKLLWQQWDGGKIFHQDPLYIYIVAVIYKIFGEDVRYVFVLQMMIGIFSVLLIYLITRKHFGNIAALISGFLAVFCGPLMFYELVLVRESFIVFAGLLLVFLLEKVLEKVSSKNFFILGVAIAFCILLKSTFILFLVLAIAILFFIHRKKLSLFIKYSAILLSGSIIAYSPLLIRNAIVGVPLFTQNSIGAVTVISSNDVAYNPEESYEFNLKHTVAILAKTNGKTLPSLIEAVKTHPDAFSYFQLLFKKFTLVFHWYEFPNNKNFYYYRIHAPVLWFSFINLLFIAPLALTGIVISIIQRKKMWALYLLMLMHLSLLVVFLVLSRYRIPLEAAMIPFAGFAVAELIKNFPSKISYSLLILVCIVVTALWVGRPLPKNITLIRGMDYQQPYRFYYKQIIDDELKKGEVKKAVNTMNDFMKLEPTEVKKLNTSSMDLNNYEIVLARVYAEFHSIFSDLYDRAGAIQESEMEANRAKELQQIVIMNDHSGSIESLMARASSAPPDQREKLYREQIALLWKEVEINPNNPGPYHALNDAYQNLNLPDSSIFVLKQLLNLNSNDYYAVFQLGTVYGKFKNDIPNAILYLEKADEIDPKSEDVCVNLGIVYSLTNQNDKAIEMMRKVTVLNPNNKNNLHNLELLLNKLGRNTEAEEVKSKLLKL